MSALPHHGLSRFVHQLDTHSPCKIGRSLERLASLVTGFEAEYSSEVISDVLWISRAIAVGSSAYGQANKYVQGFFREAGRDGDIRAAASSDLAAGPCTALDFLDSLVSVFKLRSRVP